MSTSNSKRTPYTTANHPFGDHFQKLKRIPETDRPAYQRKIDQTQNAQGQSPSLHLDEFPSSGKFSYSDYKLHYHALEQTDKPSAICLFVHGLNAHGGRAGYLAKQVTAANPGVNFYSFDQTNFGLSGGDFRGYLPPVEELVKQGEEFLKFVMKRLSQKPKVYLLGLSFGAIICTRMVLGRPIDYSGIIFLSPAFDHNRQDSYNLKLVAKFMGNFIPYYCVPTRMVSSRNTKYIVEDIMNNDPGAFQGGIVPGSIRNAMVAMDETKAQFGKFSLPFLTFMGGVEKMVDVFGAIDFDKTVSSKDKTTIYCPNMWHNVFFEEQIEAIAEITGSWLKERLSK